MFAKHAALFAELGVNVNNGLGDVYSKIKGHPKQAEVEADLMATYTTRPSLAMVDSNAVGELFIFWNIFAHVDKRDFLYPSDNLNIRVW